jgi:hypothetical protein
VAVSRPVERSTPHLHRLHASGLRSCDAEGVPSAFLMASLRAWKP